MSEKSNRLKAENARLRRERDAAVVARNKWRTRWLRLLNGVANDPRIGGPIP